MPAIPNRLNVPSINSLAVARQLLRNRLLGLHPEVIAELEAIHNARLGQYIPFSAFISRPYPPVGGRLCQFAQVWRSISSDPFILNMVSMGISLDFLSLPSQSNCHTNCKMSSEMERACDVENSELIVKRAIFPIPESSGKFFSSIFLVPKKIGGYRPIINLKNLNSHIRFEHFKMEDMDSARHLIRPGDWMVKLDLKDAYLSVPVCLEYQPFLCFRWRDICYQFTLSQGYVICSS